MIYININLFQISPSKDSEHVMFFGLKEQKELKGKVEINPDIYELVYSGDVNCKNLDDIFKIFNLEHPDVYKGRSLSVSDVIEVTEDCGDIKKGFYFCDLTDFKKIEFVKSSIQDVPTETTEIEEREVNKD